MWRPSVSVRCAPFHYAHDLGQATREVRLGSALFRYGALGRPEIPWWRKMPLGFVVIETSFNEGVAPRLWRTLSSVSTAAGETPVAAPPTKPWSGKVLEILFQDMPTDGLSGNIRSDVRERLERIDQAVRDNGLHGAQIGTFRRDLMRLAHRLATIDPTIRPIGTVMTILGDLAERPAPDPIRRVADAFEDLLTRIIQHWGADTPVALDLVRLREAFVDTAAALVFRRGGPNIAALFQTDEACFRFERATILGLVPERALFQIDGKEVLSPPLLRLAAIRHMAGQLRHYAGHHALLSRIVAAWDAGWSRIEMSYTPRLLGDLAGFDLATVVRERVPTGSREGFLHQCRATALAAFSFDVCEPEGGFTAPDLRQAAERLRRSVEAQIAALPPAEIAATRSGEPTAESIARGGISGTSGAALVHRLFVGEPADATAAAGEQRPFAATAQAIDRIKFQLRVQYRNSPATTEAFNASFGATVEHLARLVPSRRHPHATAQLGQAILRLLDCLPKTLAGDMAESCAAWVDQTMAPYLGNAMGAIPVRQQAVAQLLDELLRIGAILAVNHPNWTSSSRASSHHQFVDAVRVAMHRRKTASRHLPPRHRGKRR